MKTAWNVLRLAPLILSTGALAQRPEILPANALQVRPPASISHPPPVRAVWRPGVNSMPVRMPVQADPHLIRSGDEDARRLVEEWNRRRSPHDYERLVADALNMEGEHPRSSPGAGMGMMSDISTGWSQFGYGISQNDPATGGHNRAGRMTSAAYAYDNSQNATVLWLGSCSGGLWKAVSAGLFAIWTPVSDNLPGSPSVGAFLVQPGNSNNILIGTGDMYRFAGSGLYKTTDGGATWRLTSLSPADGSFHKIVCDAMDPTHQTVFAQGSNGIWRSTDFGDTWTQILSGWTTDLAQDPVFPYIWYAGIGGVGIYRSRDDGHTFPTSTNPADGDIASGFGSNVGRVSLSICAAQSAYVYAIAEGAESGATFGTLGGIYRSNDYGSNFVPIDNPVPDKLSIGQGFHACSIGVDPTTPDRVFCGMGRMQWTENATSSSPTWNKTLPLSDGGHPDYTGFLFEPGSTTLIITNDGGYYAFDYSAHTLSDTGNLAGLSCEQIMGNNGTMASSYNTPDFVLAGLQDNGVISLDDDLSSTWTFQSGGDGGCCSVQADSTSVMTANWGSPFSRYGTTDGGRTWFSIDEALPISGWTIGELLDPRLGWGTAPVLSWGRWTDSNGNFTNAGVYEKPMDASSPWTAVGPALPAGYLVQQIDVAMDRSTNIIYCAASNRSGQMLVYTGSMGAMALSDRTPPLPSTSLSSGCFINADKSIWQPDTVYYTTGYSTPARAFYSTNSGQNWTDVTGDLSTLLPADVHFLKLVGDPGDLNLLFLATDVGVFRSDTGGKHWYRYMNGLPATVQASDLTINYDSASPPILHVGTYGRGVWQRQVLSDATPSRLTLSPSTVVGGLSGSATVTLNGDPAPSGASVSLSTNNPNVIVPATVTVPAGSMSATFTFSTSAVASVVGGSIFASYNGTTVSARVNVLPITVSSVYLSPNVIAGSLYSRVLVSLEAPAGPGAISVSLSSSNPAIATPVVSSISIPVGASTGSADVQTTAVATLQSAIITAAANGGSQSGRLWVRPIGVKLVGLKATSVTAGVAVPGGVELEAKAAPSSITVKLASSNTSYAAVTPTSITIPKGSSIAALGSFKVLTNSHLKSMVTVLIAASANGVVKTIKLTIKPGL